MSDAPSRPTASLPEVRVALVTDSTAYLPAALVAAAPVPITVVPLHVVLDGHEYAEGVDITAEELAVALRRHRPVSTSRPSPQTFLGAYRAAAQTGATAIVSVHLSGAMSGTWESATLAAQQSPVPVEVVDSRTLGMAMGYAVLSAGEAASLGTDAKAVAAIALSRSTRATVLLYVDTMEHLRRGGRIGSASALLGSALAIKPILQVRDGSIAPVERVRTAGRALARMTEIAVSAAAEAVMSGGVDMAVQHLDAAERAEALADQLRARVPTAERVVVAELGAVVGAHVGPGAIAVAVSPRPC